MKFMILLLVILVTLPAYSELEPEAEYPAPRRRLAKTIDGIEKPISKDKRGGHTYDTSKKSKKTVTIDGIEKPIEIDDDGTYIYEDSQKKKINKIDGVEGPADVDDDGVYYYKKNQKKKAKNKYGPQPDRVNKDGSYIYDVEIEETKNNLYIRGGVMTAPNIKPPVDGGREFSDVYGDGSNFLLTVEYDWRLLPNLFLKVSSGITSADGEGQFADPSLANLSPKESFQLLIFPTIATAHYRFEIWKTQWVTPYVEGGAGYFKFAEIRSDGDKTKFGGAPVGVAGGGLLISLNGLVEGTSLYTEYGISNTWFDLQIKQILGLDSRKDFTSTLITGGFAVGF